MISRTIMKIKNISLFHRHAKNLIYQFKKNILEKDIQFELKCNSRNASFQKQLISLIDKIIDDVIDIKNPENKRLFSKEQINNKLIAQNYICNGCKCNLKNIRYEADHIISWTSGGKTTSENLQILCKRCHETKN